MPLIFEEAGFEAVSAVLSEDSGMAVWWGTWVECAVAVSRLKRESELDERGEEEARSALDRLAEDWAEVRPTDGIRLLAVLMSKYHPLKTADALQFAAALRWCGGETEGAGFICLDRRGLRRFAGGVRGLRRAVVLKFTSYGAAEDGQ